MSIVRALSAAAVVLGLLGLWLRLSRSALPAPRAGAIVAATFSPQARAAPLARSAPGGRAAGGAASASRRPPLKLYGITVGPQGAVALIDADPKIPGAEIYRVGDLVAGARLVAITDSTVTLAQPSGPLILRLPSGDRNRP